MKKLKSDDLLIKIEEEIANEKDVIIKKCGYIKNKKILANEFYNEFLSCCGFDLIDIYDEDEINFKKYMLSKMNGRSPVVDNGKIIAFYMLRISEFAYKKTWNENNWNRDNDEGNFEGPFEISIITDLRSEFSGFFSFEDAIREERIPIAQINDLLRPSYFSLNADDIGRDFNEYLIEHGEHPNTIFSILQDFKHKKLKY